MNYFTIAIIGLQIGAAIWEWSHGRIAGGTVWLGCVISNCAILFLTRN